MNELISYVDSVSEIIDPHIKRISEYSIDDKFNIFTAMSNTYRRENFHSYILKNILDPNTDSIGSQEYIKLFVEYLNSISNFSIPHFNKANVTLEEERIDILVTDDTNAVIIENKVNNAEDQPNQLARYLKYVKEIRQLNVQAIVYWVKDSNKTPNLNYDKEFQKYIPEIQEKLIVISLLEKEKNKDIVHGFLNKCIQRTDDERKLAQVFIEQYSLLLKKMGGEILMLEYYKDLFINLINNKESVEKINSISKMWEQRNYIVPNIFIPELLNACQNEDYLLKEDNLISKKLSDTILLEFGYEKDCDYYFQFTKVTENFNKNDMKKLEVILNMNRFNEISASKAASHPINVYRYYTDAPKPEELYLKMNSSVVKVKSILKGIEEEYNKM